MARIVQKYGGTSVKDIDCIRSVANRIKESYIKGNEMIVVVSARAGVTDRLISDAKKLSAAPNSREVDVLLCVGEQEAVAFLSIALDAIGVRAVSRLAFQIGLQTCPSHGNARIEHIQGANIEKLLAEKNVVIVAGFQGISENGDLTTLGRGGSDLTALALAHRFQADRCEIYTDVNGVYTGDPKIIQRAKLIEKIDFESLLRLSFFDSKIMQDRSVAFAQKNNIPFTISNTFGNSPGTSVVEQTTRYESYAIGITNKTNLCLVSCKSREDIVSKVLMFFESHGVALDFIKHRYLDDHTFFDEISLDMLDFLNLQDEFRESFRPDLLSLSREENLSRIDVIGTNIQAHPKIAQIFDIIPQQTILRSEYGKHGLSFLIRSDNYKRLLNDVHDLIF
ncbi:MAG: aspartate kinase [Puniceicoccales bacterium]|jgi:aspartate kinase|nr:aspartate kinase [Puniceicoccales bacterium]